jgi:K+-transporting ATPase KdpF subunit
MSPLLIVTAIFTVLVFVYLVYALIKAEEF